MASTNKDKKSEKKHTKKAVPSSAAGRALRLGTELIAAVGMGAGIGFALDHWLGTKPWMMIIMFFLGAAAGILNVYRVALMILEEDDPESNENKKIPSDDPSA